MYRFLLTPRWLLLHLFVIVAVLSCLALGRWQWSTYQETSSQQALREQAPEPITNVLEPAEPLGNAADRAVTVSGQYDEPVVVPDRVHDGVLGDYQAASFTSDSGEILVVRGWSDTPSERPALPQVRVQLTGHLLPAETANDATVPEASAASPGRLNYLDPALLDRATSGGEPRYAGYLLVSDQEPGDLGGLEPLEITQFAPVNDVNPWQNLSYWAQWWVFAAAAVVFWASFVRAGVRARRGGATEEADAGGDEAAGSESAATVTSPERSLGPSG